MNSYNSFITDDESYKFILVNSVKNLKYVQVLNSKLINSGRAVAHLMNFKKYAEIDLAECFFNSIMISLEEIDDDWNKNIFLLSNNLIKKQFQIQKWLDFEKQISIFEEYANFYIFTNENVEFDHPQIKIFNLEEVENKIVQILNEELI